MLRGFLDAINPVRWAERLIRPLCWDITWFDGDYEIETNAITGEHRHRLTAFTGGKRIEGPWMPGKGPVDTGPQDLDLLLSPADMARRFCPLNAPIPVPSNER